MGISTSLLLSDYEKAKAIGDSRTASRILEQMGDAAKPSRSTKAQSAVPKPAAPRKSELKVDPGRF